MEEDDNFVGIDDLYDLIVDGCENALFCVIHAERNENIRSRTLLQFY